MLWTVIGSLASLIANFDVLKSSFNKRTVNMDRFMQFKNMTPAIQRRVRRHFNYLWSDTKGASADVVIRSLPYRLRIEVLMHLFSEKLRKCLGGPKISAELNNEVIEGILMRVSLEQV